METKIYYTVLNLEFDNAKEEKFSSVQKMAEYLADQIDTFDYTLESFKIYKKIELTESVDVNSIRSQVDECLKAIKSED